MSLEIVPQDETVVLEGDAEPTEERVQIDVPLSVKENQRFGALMTLIQTAREELSKRRQAADLAAFGLDAVGDAIAQMQEEIITGFVEDPQALARIQTKESNVAISYDPGRGVLSITYTP